MGRPVFKAPYGNFFLSAGCVSHIEEKTTKNKTLDKEMIHGIESVSLGT